MSADEQIAGLVARLERGWQKIDQARAAGKETGALEDFWEALLHQYERAVDNQRQATLRGR